MKKVTLFYAATIVMFMAACTPKDQLTKTIINHANGQLSAQCAIVDASEEFINPSRFENGQIEYVPQDDWVSGFFPGTILEYFALTGDSSFLERGLRYTEALDTIQRLKWHHDVGFMVMTSYGNAYRLTGKEEYKDKITEAAQSLATRFRPAAGVFQSWDENRGWQGKRGWMCPTIIDNMMNLELMFEATCLTGDSSFWKMAVSHADTTMKYHFRPDYSTYHVVDYDKVNGGIRSRCTAQGYADESCWARGEAWALYGYAVCYRYTGDERYLEQAKLVYDYIFTHTNLPEDKVPYWDFNAPDIPNACRDASAAAVILSALYELDQWVPQYRTTAEQLLSSLASDAYLAPIGENGNFLLMHSVSSLPHGSGIDVPLNYADYYLLEALCRRCK